MIITKPPMGWNTRNVSRDNFSESLIRETADIMVSGGLRDAGYEYVVIDDCLLMKERGTDGRVVPDPEKFPYGMKALADYVHSKGLKFGISCRADNYDGDPAGFDKASLDAETFAGWGADYLKYDFCNLPTPDDLRIAYTRIKTALQATGRDIVFSACSAGRTDAGLWARSAGADIFRCGECGTETTPSDAETVRSENETIRYSAPGCFNDTDTRAFGTEAYENASDPEICGDVEFKSRFALRCLNSQPLMISSDLRSLRPEILDLLKNPDLIRIDQDEECRPPMYASIKGDICPTFFKHLSDHQFAVGFFNLSDGNGSADFRTWDIGLTINAGFGMMLRDVFTGETMGPINDFVSLELAPHDCRVFIGEWVDM